MYFLTCLYIVAYMLRGNVMFFRRVDIRMYAIYGFMICVVVVPLFPRTFLFLSAGFRLGGCGLIAFIRLACAA